MTDHSSNTSNITNSFTINGLTIPAGADDIGFEKDLKSMSNSELVTTFRYYSEALRRLMSLELEMKERGMGKSDG